MKLPLLVCAFLSAATPAFAADAPVPPDILVILADDLGYGDVHALNPERERTMCPWRRSSFPARRRSGQSDP